MKINKKLSSILWALAYLVVGASILVSSCLIFHNNYFTLVYVDGSSMSPTLNKNGVTEFGIIDSHEYRINSISRFDIVTTYYPIAYSSSGGMTSDYSYIDSNGYERYTSFDDSEHKVQVSSTANYKIKRIIALPGEQFKVNTNGVEIKTQNEDGTWGDATLYEFPFTHANGDKTDKDFRILGQDEYWVIGDNWGSSIDSHELNMKIKKQNLTGVLIAIEGTCKVETKNGQVKIKNKKYYSSYRYF